MGQTGPTFAVIAALLLAVPVGAAANNAARSLRVLKNGKQVKAPPPHARWTVNPNPKPPVRSSVERTRAGRCLPGADCTLELFEVVEEASAATKSFGPRLRVVDDLTLVEGDRLTPGMKRLTIVDTVDGRGYVGSATDGLHVTVLETHGLPLEGGRFVGGYVHVGPQGEPNWVGYSTSLPPGDLRLAGGDAALLQLIRDAGFTPALAKSAAAAP